MYVPCDCGNQTFLLQFIPPSGLVVECDDCGAEQPVGETEQMLD